MIVNADAKGLEVVCAAYLSQDKVLMQELWDGVDIHSMNQQTFGLPSRGIAKILKFRILYGGTAYSFAKDPDFTGVSTSVKYWEKVIEKYYDKYKGLAQWHNNIIQQVTLTKKLVMPTGRVYEYTLTPYGDWPVTQIKNFPVQGLGADVVSVARVAFYKRLKKQGFIALPIATVHDSIVLDSPPEEVAALVSLFHEVFKDTPKLFEQWFGKPFNLPLQCEVSTGHNMADLKEFKLAA